VELAGEESRVNHGSLDVADAHEVPGAQGARIRDHEAAHRLVHEPARAEGDHQTNEDAARPDRPEQRARRDREQARLKHDEAMPSELASTDEG